MSNVRSSSVYSFADVRLYVLLTEERCVRPWLETARLALEGGADAVQLREKSLPDRDLLHRARQLSGLCAEMHKIFIVNDRPDIARLCGAAGVHLGRDDVSVRQARSLLGSRAIVGVSTHTPEQVEAANASAPDYIAVGPMFASETKPQRCVPGPPLIGQARPRTAAPIVPIGGIDQNNAPEVLGAGATCLCVCAAVVGDQDPLNAALRLRDLVVAHQNLRPAAADGCNTSETGAR